MLSFFLFFQFLYLVNIMLYEWRLFWNSNRWYEDWISMLDNIQLDKFHNIIVIFIILFIIIIDYCYLNQYHCNRGCSQRHVMNE